jgi:uncharacterized protein YjbI with pentapeptide repeats
MRHVCWLAAAVVAASTVLLTAATSTPENETRVKETGSCPGCDLRFANLSGLVAREGDLTNADLAGANLYMATLAGADLTGAALQDADLSGAILSGAKGVNFAGAITDAKTLCPDGSNGPCQ